MVSATDSLQPQPVSSASHYQPSGRVSLGRFVPLILLGVVVALVMAFVLCLLEANWYFFIFTPFIVGLPVFGALLVVIRVGRCRNRVVGAIVGLLLLGLYYGGYWTMSYMLNVVWQGPEVVEYVREEGGAPGLPGYFRFRCRKALIKSTHDMGAPHRRSNDADAFGAYMLYGLEWVLILGAGFVAGRNNGGRVFYENLLRWSSAAELRFAGSEFRTVYGAAQSQDWTPLSRLARLPKLGGGAGSSFVAMKVEYAPGATGEPVYVTISGMNLGKNPAARAVGMKGWGGISKVFVRQQSASNLSALAQTLPEFAAVVAAPTQATSARIAAGPTLHTERPSVLRSALEKAGMIGKKATGPDFRESAVKISTALLSGSARVLNPADLNRSLCLRADSNPAAKLRSAARIELKLIVAAAVLMVGGAMIAAVSEAPRNEAQRMSAKANPVMVVVGGTMFGIGLTGFVVALVAGTALRKQTLMRTLCRRTGAVFGPEAQGATMVARIENAQTFHLMKSAPEDIGVCLFDQPRRRLLIEGISHRYVICGSDVTKLALLNSAQTTTLHLNYRVGDGELTLALSSGGLGRHVALHSPLFMWLASRSSKKLVRQFQQTLNVPG